MNQHQVLDVWNKKTGSPLFNSSVIDVEFRQKTVVCGGYVKPPRPTTHTLELRIRGGLSNHLNPPALRILKE